MTAPTDRKPIVVTVRGGCVQHVSFPKDCPVPVEVRDYDVDGEAEDRLDRDAEGHPCVKGVWRQQEDQAGQKAEPATTEDEPGLQAVAQLTEAEARSILGQIYEWVYWDHDRGRWHPEKEIGGGDTVEFLCWLLPPPPKGP